MARRRKVQLQMKRRGWRPSKNWVASYAGLSTESSVRRRSTISFLDPVEKDTTARSHSVRNTTDSVATALSGLQLQERFGKISMALRSGSCRWFESWSKEGNRGVLLTVMGQPYSKANSRRLVTGPGGKLRSIKSDAARAYALDFEAQCPVLDFMLEGELRVVGAIMYASMRPDLDESLILDLGQGRLYKNDRQITEKFFVRGVDTERPRAVLLFEELRPRPLELPL